MPVSLVTEAQHESLIDLLCELHAYYNDGAAAARETVREHLQDNLLATGSPHRLVVAADDTGAVIGLAAITLVYSLVEPGIGQRRHCQLKELYVRSDSRGHGAGRAMMQWVAAYTWQQGCRRMDWPVQASNTRGIAFYEGLGAERVVERLSYRISGERMSRLATGATQHGPP